MENESHDSLSDDRRLNQVLTRYLEALRSGDEPSREQLLSEYPDLADSLKGFFANHDRMQSVTDPSEQEAASIVPSDSGEEKTCPPSHDDAATEDATVAPTVSDVPSVNTTVRYFGDYELLEEIARGGMGVVFRARQAKLNRIVAIKMILAGQLAGDEDVKRFHAEAEAAAQLDHPGIVPIFEVGEHDGQHYFSMGYVDGGSLALKIQDGPLPPRKAVEYVKKVAEAVAYAHAKGVIHRDLKPGNVLLDSNDEPKVTDFGLAKRVEVDGGLTATGQILGTPSYMPPEQAAGKSDDVKEAADVYSLGAILYTLVTGRPPFQADNPLDTLLQVLEREPVSARQLNQDVPRDLETICSKCLEKQPQNRYDSASEFVAELQRFQNGEPIKARPINSPTRVWRWCKRKPIVSGLIATVLLSVLTGSMVSMRLANQSDRNAASAEHNAALAHDSANLAEEARDEANLRTLDSYESMAESLLAQTKRLKNAKVMRRQETAIHLIQKSISYRDQTNELLASWPSANETVKSRSKSFWASLTPQLADEAAFWLSNASLQQVSSQDIDDAAKMAKHRTLQNAESITITDGSDRLAHLYLCEQDEHGIPRFKLQLHHGKEIVATPVIGGMTTGRPEDHDLVPAIPIGASFIDGDKLAVVVWHGQGRRVRIGDELHSVHVYSANSGKLLSATPLQWGDSRADDLGMPRSWSGEISPDGTCVLVHTQTRDFGSCLTAFFDLKSGKLEDRFGNLGTGVVPIGFWKSRDEFALLIGVRNIHTRGSKLLGAKGLEIRHRERPDEPSTRIEFQQSTGRPVELSWLRRPWFSPDRRFIAGFYFTRSPEHLARHDTERHVAIVNTETGKSTAFAVVPGKTSGVFSPGCFSPDGRMLVIAEPEQLAVISVSDGTSVLNQLTPYGMSTLHQFTSSGDDRSVRRTPAAPPQVILLDVLFRGNSELIVAKRDMVQGVREVLEYWDFSCPPVPRPTIYRYDGPLSSVALGLDAIFFSSSLLSGPRSKVMPPFSVGRMNNLPSGLQVYRPRGRTRRTRSSSSSAVEWTLDAAPRYGVSSRCEGLVPSGRHLVSFQRPLRTRYNETLLCWDTLTGQLATSLQNIELIDVTLDGRIIVYRRGHFLNWFDTEHLRAFSYKAEYGSKVRLSQDGRRLFVFENLLLHVLNVADGTAENTFDLGEDGTGVSDVWAIRINQRGTRVLLAVEERGSNALQRQKKFSLNLIDIAQGTILWKHASRYYGSTFGECPPFGSGSLDRVVFEYESRLWGWSEGMSQPQPIGKYRRPGRGAELTTFIEGTTHVLVLVDPEERGAFTFVDVRDIAMQKSVWSTRNENTSVASIRVSQPLGTVSVLYDTGILELRSLENGHVIHRISSLDSQDTEVAIQDTAQAQEEQTGEVEAVTQRAYDVDHLPGIRRQSILAEGRCLYLEDDSRRTRIVSMKDGSDYFQVDGKMLEVPPNSKDSRFILVKSRNEASGGQASISAINLETRKSVPLSIHEKSLLTRVPSRNANGQHLPDRVLSIHQDGDHAEIQLIRLDTGAVEKRQTIAHVPSASDDISSVIARVEMTPDAKVLALNIHRQWRLIDTDTGDSIATLPQGGQVLGANKLALTHDGRWLASAGNDATIGLWRAEDGQYLGVAELKDIVENLAFALDAHMIVACDRSGDLSAWEITAAADANALGRQDLTLAWRTQVLAGDTLAVGNNGTWVAALKGENQVQVLQATDGQGVATLSVDGAVAALAVAPLKPEICLAFGDVIETWELPPDGESWRRTGQSSIPEAGPLSRLAYSADGTLLAVAGSHLRIFAARPLQSLFELKQFDRAVKDLAFTRSGWRLAALGQNRQIAVWDLESMVQRLVELGLAQPTHEVSPSREVDMPASNTSVSTQQLPTTVETMIDEPVAKKLVYRQSENNTSEDETNRGKDGADPPRSETKLVESSELRLWTDIEGRTKTARFLGVDGSVVRLENSQGQVYRLPLDVLSLGDQEFVLEEQYSAEPADLAD